MASHAEQIIELSLHTDTLGLSNFLYFLRAKPIISEDFPRLISYASDYVHRHVSEHAWIYRQEDPLPEERKNVQDIIDCCFTCEPPLSNEEIQKSIISIVEHNQLNQVLFNIILSKIQNPILPEYREKILLAAIDNNNKDILNLFESEENFKNIIQSKTDCEILKMATNSEMVQLLIAKGVSPYQKGVSETQNYIDLLSHNNYYIDKSFQKDSSQTNTLSLLNNLRDDYLKNLSEEQSKKQIAQWILDSITNNNQNETQEWSLPISHLLQKLSPEYISSIRTEQGLNIIQFIAMNHPDELLDICDAINITCTHSTMSEKNNNGFCAYDYYIACSDDGHEMTRRKVFFDESEYSFAASDSSLCGTDGVANFVNHIITMENLHISKIPHGSFLGDVLFSDTTNKPKPTDTWPSAFFIKSISEHNSSTFSSTSDSITSQLSNRISKLTICDLLSFYKKTIEAETYYSKSTILHLLKCPWTKNNNLDAIADPEANSFKNIINAVINHFGNANLKNFNIIEDNILNIQNHFNELQEFIFNKKFYSFCNVDGMAESQILNKNGFFYDLHTIVSAHCDRMELQKIIQSQPSKKTNSL